MDKESLIPTMAVLDELQAARLAELFSTLSDARRVQIIAALLSGPMDVQSLAGIVGISEFRRIAPFAWAAPDAPGELQ